jgi:hypothetical protein
VGAQGKNVRVAGRGDAGRTSPWSEGDDRSRPDAAPGWPRRREQPDRPDRDGPADPPGRLAGVIALFVLAVLGAALAGPWNPPTRTESLIPWDPPDPRDVAIPQQDQPELRLADLVGREDVRPWDLTWLGLGLLVVVVAWIAWLVVRWFRRHPVELPPESPDDAGLDLGETLREIGRALCRERV